MEITVKLSTVEEARILPMITERSQAISQHPKVLSMLNNAKIESVDVMTQEEKTGMFIKFCLLCEAQKHKNREMELAKRKTIDAIADDFDISP